MNLNILRYIGTILNGLLKTTFELSYEVANY